MKKLLLAAAIMTTFASASAFAGFDAEKDGTNQGNVNLSGQITGDVFKWVSAIDSNPAGLNSKTAKTAYDWKETHGSQGFTMDLGLSGFEPLVYVRTLGDATFNKTTPVITMRDATGEEVIVTSGPKTLTLPVEMGTVEGDYSPQAETKATVEVAFDFGYGITSDVGGTKTAEASNHSTGGRAAVALMLANQSYESLSAPSEVMFYNTWELATNMSPGGHADVAIAGIAGATKATLVTTATTKPVGFWQASIPVTVSYK